MPVRYHQDPSQDLSRLTIHEGEPGPVMTRDDPEETNAHADANADPDIDAFSKIDDDSDGGVPLMPFSPKTKIQLHPAPSQALADHSSQPLALDHQFDHLQPSNGQRNRSSYTRSHLRSRSSGAAFGGPAIMRAHSSPSMNAVARSFEPGTQASNALPTQTSLRSPSARQRSPFRAQLEDSARPSSVYEAVPGSAIEAIQEDSELDINPDGPQPLPLQYVPSSFSRSSSLRRRPASPLHTVATLSVSTSMNDHSNTMNPSPAPHSSESPSLAPQRFNENHPSLHHYSSTSSFSSLSSTPSSQRSRSPSISSLETIEDAPDLESKAIEAERIERLKAAAERANQSENNEDGDDNSRSRSSLDVPRGFGFGRGGNRERKRWSVCGGERRADLDLETIWED